MELNWILSKIICYNVITHL